MYGALVAVLCLARDGQRVLLRIDSLPAVKILGRRFCAANQTINKYIGFFDYMCTIRNVSMQVIHVPREENYAAHHLAYCHIRQAKKLVALGRKVPVRWLKKFSL